MRTPDHDHRSIPRRHPDGLHVCVDCGSTLVQPVEWVQLDEDAWQLTTWCPECDHVLADTVDQDALDAYERELDQGVAALARAYDRIVRENLDDDAQRLAAALAVDALLPEDF